MSAAFGFIFWALAARTTTPADVGIATAALAGSSLLLSLCDLGLITAVVYFAASRKELATQLVNTSISAGWMLSSMASLLFLAGSPIWAAGLLPIRNDTLLAATFVVFTTLNYLLGLQDAAMLSRRRAQYVFWRNVACNVPPLFLLFPLLFLIGTHRAALIAYSLPNILVGVVVGLLVLPRYFVGYHFFGHFDRSLLSGLASYGLATHGANLLWGCTNYVLPIIAINTLSADSTGYFYINWTFVNFILIIPRAVVSSLFVEGVHTQTRMNRAVIESLLLILVLSLPLIVGLWFWGDWLLGLFGKGYIDMPLLRLLLLSVVPFSINSIFLMSLRLHERLLQAVIFSAIIAIGVVGLASLLAPHIGVEGIAWGWLLGHGLPTLGITGIMTYVSLKNWWKRRVT